MTFEEAMHKSLMLKLDAIEGIALRLPDSRERLDRYIDFNPFMYSPDLLGYQQSESRK